jgi:hypothetical protein
MMQLVEENAHLHSELKNVTVHEMLLALENEDPRNNKSVILNNLNKIPYQNFTTMYPEYFEIMNSFSEKTN